MHFLKAVTGYRLTNYKRGEDITEQLRVADIHMIQFNPILTYLFIYMLN
jgi:hypothetical protein